MALDVYTGTGARLTSPQLPTYVTSLPSGPIDGQEVYYAADATNGVIWHLRYRSGSSSSYKWEFVGGNKLFATVDTNQQNSTTGWQNLTTAGPSITLPLAGDYIISYAALISNTSSNAYAIAIGIAVGDTTPTSTDQAIIQPMYTANSSTGYVQLFAERLQTAQAASTAWKMRYYAATDSTGRYFQNRRITAIPVRVG